MRTLQFSARVATFSRVDIGSTVTGRVAQVRVSEGAEVREGDVLVQLEDSEWRAALAQAEGGEAQARARLAACAAVGAARRTRRSPGRGDLACRQQRV
ncbi:MAG: biotin/lipoyl-binding protein [Simplicispira sp.]|nr:biotin/lipoyl-binding protein [Simplicispira sp.]